MGVRKAEIFDIAADWALDGSELKAAVGRAIMAISDATESVEAQNDGDLVEGLEKLAVELYELTEEQES